MERTALRNVSIVRTTLFVGYKMENVMILGVLVLDTSLRFVTVTFYLQTLCFSPFRDIYKTYINIKIRLYITIQTLWMSLHLTNIVMTALKKNVTTIKTMLFVLYKVRNVMSLVVLTLDISLLYVKVKCTPQEKKPWIDSKQFSINRTVCSI